ncbi:MAG TPA: sigma-70 family RNA polymerase sigma factor [Sphingomonas sp.]|uniref:sigma-70 family RNA polymerase sigma factor n=1 Tax=Sphingomonas sp. TaxID=28214 RepID=UPI002CFE2577|nr:sigma-70 family RNA polymerase sigma factor [Sphingomonas sp.]HMI20844.1 sigma-70 family RNA polymerase sigma factor [Sphingomonas sp.]
MSDGPDSLGAAADFDPLRPRLIRVAYRMLGSMADAEDVVQDAFLRWLATDRDAVREPEAFLRRVVTRLSLDQLKSARVRRETYLGEWLPEPILEAEPVEDVTLPLLIALERLSPLERAAFLLHDVFGLDFDEVAQSIDRDPAACRQLAARARTHVQSDRPRYTVEKSRGLELAAAFFQASRGGDMEQLQAILAQDVSSHADGGGKRPAGYLPIFGIDNVMKLQRSLVRLYGGGQSELVSYGFVNGLPGFVTREADGILQTTALLIVDGRVHAIYVMRNPDKLGHLGEGRVH